MREALRHGTQRVLLAPPAAHDDEPHVAGLPHLHQDVGGRARTIQLGRDPLDAGGLGRRHGGIQTLLRALGVLPDVHHHQLGLADPRERRGDLRGLRGARGAIGAEEDPFVGQAGGSISSP